MNQQTKMRGLLLVSGGVIVAAGLGLAGRRAESKSGIHETPNPSRSGLAAPSNHSPAATGWQDSRGDGFPDAVRLTGADRDSFVRWMTFIGEAQYYRVAGRSR